jgi:hypothetical protein
MLVFFVVFYVIVLFSVVISCVAFTISHWKFRHHMHQLHSTVFPSVPPRVTCWIRGLHMENAEEQATVSFSIAVMLQWP